LHGTVLLDGPPELELELLARAERASVGFHPLSVHRHAPGPPGLVIGYSRPAVHEFRVAVERLGQLVSTLPAPGS
jgi:GntR family transcriptional regulator/MocR family aminotransferase